MREKAREELVCLLTGWTCLRISWADLARPELLAARIRGVIAARARRERRLSYLSHPSCSLVRLRSRPDKQGRSPDIRGLARQRRGARAYAGHSASTGTWLVVEVGWLAKPCRSNFCPLASPPSQKEKRAITTPARSSAM